MADTDGAAATAAAAAAAAAADAPAAAADVDAQTAAAQAALQAAMQATSSAAAPANDPMADLQQAAASLGINLNADSAALLRQLTASLGGGGGGAAAAPAADGAAADANGALRALAGAAAGGGAAGALGGLLDGAAGALGQQLSGGTNEALAALAAQIQQPGGGGNNTAAMLASLGGGGVPLDPFTQLQTLGLRYQSFMDEKDTQMLEAARRTHNVMHLTIQVLQVPSGVTADGAMPAVELELPGAADLACLKRAVSRASAGLLPPHCQRYFVSDTGAPLTGDSNLLLSWDLTSGSQLYLVVVENEPPHSMRTHQVSLHGAFRIPAIDGGEEDYDGGRLASGLPESEDGDDDSRRRGYGKSYQSKKPRREGDEEGPQPRQRFTEEEILALVEGVRLFGTSWARIKSTFSTQLARRTQVNIKDKWRNLQRGLQTNWRDERSHLSEDTKEKIRQLNDALTQQTFSGLPAGLPLLPMGGGDPLSNMTQLAAFAQVQTAHLAAAQAAAQAAAAVAGAPAAEGPTADDLAVAAAAAAAAATVAAQGDADAATE